MLGTSIHKFADIEIRTINRTVRQQDNHAYPIVRFAFADAHVQFVAHGHRQGVSLVRAIQRNDPNAFFPFHFKVYVCHRGSFRPRVLVAMNDDLRRWIQQRLGCILPRCRSRGDRLGLEFAFKNHIEHFRQVRARVDAACLERHAD